MTFKPVEAWAIEHPEQGILSWTVRRAIFGDETQDSDAAWVALFTGHVSAFPPGDHREEAEARGYRCIPVTIVPRGAVVFESAAEFSEFLDSQTVDAELTPMEALAEWRKSREAKP